MEILFFAGLILACLIVVRSIAKEYFIAKLFERYGIGEVDQSRDYRWGLFVWRERMSRRRRYSGLTMMSSGEEGLALKCVFPLSIWLRGAVIPWSEIEFEGRKKLVVGLGTYAVFKFRNGLDGEIMIPIDLAPIDLRERTERK